MQQPPGSETSTTGPPERLKWNFSRAAFALVLIALGILGLIQGDLAPGLSPVPDSTPVRLALAYLCDIIYIACGLGLLWRRTASLAARVLLFFFLLWLLLLRMPWMVVSFQIGTWWPASSTAVLTGSAWMLYSSLADNWDRRHCGFFVGDRGLSIGRILFGLGLIPLGIAHFLYVDATAPLVPGWLLFPVFWAYFTGGAFIAAGLAIISNAFALLASALVTLQIACLTVFVWAPRIFAGNMTAFQWNEFVVSILLTAAAWIAADSYRSARKLGTD